MAWRGQEGWTDLRGFKKTSQLGLGPFKPRIGACNCAVWHPALARRSVFSSVQFRSLTRWPLQHPHGKDRSAPAQKRPIPMGSDSGPSSSGFHRARVETLEATPSNLICRTRKSPSLAKSLGMMTTSTKPSKRLLEGVKPPGTPDWVPGSNRSPSCSNYRVSW